MRRLDFICPNEHVQENVWVQYGERPPCPTCGGAVEILWRSSFPNIIGDECDFTVEHMAAEPIRFRSKSEHRRMCKQLGLRVKDSHVGTQGSDKSPLTRKWF
jgi:hypothetical protein